MLAVLGVVACVAAGVARGAIHELRLQDDDRALFEIETFGFEAGGHLKLEADKFHLYGEVKNPLVGLLLVKMKTESQVTDAIEEANEKNKCVLTDVSDNTFMMRLDKLKKGKGTKDFIISEPGLYALLMARCEPTKGKISVDLRASFYNPGPNYLSVGDQPMPWLYFVMALCFAAGGAVWVWWMRNHSSKVHTIHYLFTALIIFKFLATLFEAFAYMSVRASGHSSGFNVMFYIFGFLKALLVFAIILLVGAGWTIVKPLLNDREKRLFMVVVPLQILVQVCIIVVDEIAPGSKAYNTWRTLLHLADIVCCLLVLLPVVWSIRHLSAAAGADGKARDTVNRLMMFRSFYLSVIVYIYFTRIIVYVMRLTLTYRLTWLAPLFDELAAFAFYGFTAYLFRPGAENPYVRVPTDEDDEEFGLQDGDEVDTARVPRETAITTHIDDPDDIVKAADEEEATGAAAPEGIELVDQAPKQNQD